MTDEFVFGAADLISHLKTHSKLTVQSLPRTALICLSPSIATQISKEQNWRSENALGARWTFAGESLVLVSGFGMGAPACAAKIEEMRALGVRRIAVIGTAGALQSDQRAGDVVLLSRAWAAEGTSKHYSGDKSFDADENFLSEIAQGLRAKGIPFKTGATWSTDAPYRERRTELAQLQNRGVLTVEMEASAVYAVARELQMPAAVVVLVSDELTDGRWRPQFGKSELRDRFIGTAAALMQILARLKT